MGFCSVRWCGKSSKSSSYKIDGITFHRYPKSPTIKSKWIDATHRGEAWFPSKTCVICSRHFTADCFHSMTNRRRLLNSAVPTLYLPILAAQPEIEAPPSGMDVDHTVEVKVERQLDVDVGTSTSIKLETDLTQLNTTVAVPMPQSVNYAGTSKKQDYESLVRDLMSPNLQNSGMQTPTKKGRKTRDPDSPSAYDTPGEKRLCRRIVELKSVVKEKNDKLRKLRDSNRRLKRQITSLKFKIEELEKK